MAIKVEGKKEKKDTIGRLRLAKDLIGVTSSLGESLLSASSLRNRSSGYRTNATLSRADAIDAVRVGQENAQIVNIERYKTKGKQLSYFAGSGFAAGSGSYADTIAATDSEYIKTMATIHFEAEANKNAFEFEAKQADLESNYLSKVSRIQSRTAVITGIAGIATSIGMSQLRADIDADADTDLDLEEG